MRAYYFSGIDKRTGSRRMRRTPVLANSAKEARKRLRRPSPKAKSTRLEYSRALTSSQKKTARRGNWVKGDKRNRSARNRGFGPRPKARR